MTKLKQASDAGKLSTVQVATSLVAFREIYAWAATRFGQAMLDQAGRHFRTRARLYKPPSMDWLIRSGFEDPPEGGAEASSRRWNQAYLFPPVSEASEAKLPFWTRVPYGAVEKVQAIESEALAKGWTPAGLYQNRGKPIIYLRHDSSIQR